MFLTFLFYGGNVFQGAFVTEAQAMRYVANEVALGRALAVDFWTARRELDAPIASWMRGYFKRLHENHWREVEKQEAAGRAAKKAGG